MREKTVFINCFAYVLGGEGVCADVLYEQTNMSIVILCIGECVPTNYQLEVVIKVIICLFPWNS